MSSFVYVIISWRKDKNLQIVKFYLNRLIIVGNIAWFIIVKRWRSISALWTVEVVHFLYEKDKSFHFVNFYPFLKINSSWHYGNKYTSLSAY